MKNNKNKIILLLTLTLIVMAVGYSLLSTRIQVTGNVNLHSKWSISIPEDKGIVCTSNRDDDSIDIKSSVIGTNVNFAIKFAHIGDEVTCNINVVNNGSLNARVSKIIVTDYEKFTTGPIRVHYSGIKADEGALKDGTKLLSSSNNTMSIKIEYVDDIVTLENKDQNINISVEYIQDL